MKHWTDLEIIQGIRDKDPEILKILYDEYYPLVHMNLLEHSATETEVKDVFQEAIILIYRKIKDGTFQMNTNFRNYFLSVTWYIWIKELRTKNNQSRIIENYNYLQDTYAEHNLTDEEYKLHMQYKLYQKYFKKLTKKCRKILRWHLKNISLKEIAKKAGLKDEKSVKKRKHACKEQLIRLIKEDKRFNLYHEDE